VSVSLLLDGALGALAMGNVGPSSPLKL